MKKSDAEGYRPTKQARSARSEQLLLDAAEKLFAEKGYQGTKVTDIIDLSGCSIGTFYHRFGDKEGLAKVMITRFIDDGRALIETFDLSQATHGDLRRMLGFLAGVLFDTMNARLGAYRAAQRLNTLSSENVANTVVLVAPLEARLLAHLPDYSDEITAPDPETALGHALQLLIMVTLQTRLGAGPLFPRDRQGLIDMMVRAAMGLLQPGDTA